MTTPIYQATATASIPALSLTLDVRSCKVTLDATRAPYVEARLTVAGLTADDLEQIDPRSDPRILISAETVWISPSAATQTREFDLLVHQVIRDPDADTVAIVAVSDEALLIDGGYLADVEDDRFRVDAEAGIAYLGDFANSILDDLSLTNIVTTDGHYQDADYFLTTESTNLIPNPKAASNTTGWITSTANSTLSRYVDGSGNTWFRSTAIGAGNAGMALGTAASGVNAGVACTAGVTYKVVLNLQMSTARTIYLALRFYNSSGTQVGSDVTGSVFFAPTGTYLITGATAPAGAVKAQVIVYMTGATAGNTLDVRRVRLSVQDDYDNTQEYFDGDTADDTRYSYEWVGTANASNSKRLPLDDRDPDLLVLKPGQGWWDFLQPLARARDLRLWCDEDRVWHLTARAITVAGTVAITAADNATELTDTISMQAVTEAGTPVYFTGVVVRYQWTDATGTVQTRYDYAGTGRKVWRVTIERPWPGAGAAAALLAAAADRGRTQTASAIINLDATPGMGYSASGMPGLTDQEGAIAAVTFQWSQDGPEHGSMIITPRDLVDA